MPKKLEESVAVRIRSDLESGLSQQDVAERNNVSMRTVQRIKKEADTSDLSTYQKKFIRAHHITVPPNLQGKIDPIKYYRLGLHDPLEGWDVIVEKGDIRRKGFSHYFAGIVYASPEEFEELIKVADEAGISLGYAPHDGNDVWDHDSPPVRDPDTGVLVYAEGERWKRLDPKKAHIHVMSWYETAVSWSTNQKLMDEIFGLNTTSWIVVGNPLKMWKYFAHDTDQAREKGKYRYYMFGEIRKYINNFHIEPTKHDRDLMALEIVNFILNDMFKTYGRFEYADLLQQYHSDEYVLSVIRGNTNMLAHLIDSKRHSGEQNLGSLSDEKLDELYQVHRSEAEKIAKERDRRQRERLNAVSADRDDKESDSDGN